MSLTSFPSDKVEGEPPRKRKRSKWDIHPEDLPTPPSNLVAIGNHETTPPQAPTSAAAAVAAKLNAKLASEGKLKPASAVYMPASSSVSLSSPSPLAPPLLPSFTPGHAYSGFIVGTPTGPSSSTIEINDLDVREQLTKPATLNDINKTTGVMVTVRGKQLTSQENNNIETPLHLHIQGPNKDKVDAAVIYINSLIRSLQQARGKGGVALLSTPPIPPLPQQQSSGPHYIQDKVFVGLEKAPEEFKAKSRVEGIGGSFLGHIASQTGAKVYLRGRGSGFLEPTSGRESFEAMYLYISHSNQEGLTAARKLCESLIQTVQKDFEMWKRSQQPLGFGGQPPQYHRPQFSNPYQQHGAYLQPPFAPILPSAGGPNFGPPPPGAYPPPPPGYGFYPSPSVPHPAVPYGGPPPHPGGFGPPPPAEFQPPPPGPPYHHQPLPPQQIPLPPPDAPTSAPSSYYQLPNQGSEGTASGSSGPAQPNPPTKRRFTETVPKSTNGLSSSSSNDSAPYWAKLQEPLQPRPLTEGPLTNQQGPLPDQRGPLMNQQGPLTSPQESVPTQQGPPLNQQVTSNVGGKPLPTTTLDQTRTTADQEMPNSGQVEPKEEATLAKDGNSRESKLMSPPPPPPPPPAVAGEKKPTDVASMPPPSFLPPRVTSVAATTGGHAKPSESPPPPPPPSTNDDPSPSSPPPSSSPPPPPPPPPSKPKLSGPLVSYGDDSDSDVDS